METVRSSQDTRLLKYSGLFMHGIRYKTANKGFEKLSQTSAWLPATSHDTQTKTPLNVA
jgi:hypothetical protein